MHRSPLQATASRRPWSAQHPPRGRCPTVRRRCGSAALQRQQQLLQRSRRAPSSSSPAAPGASIVRGGGRTAADCPPPLFPPQAPQLSCGKERGRSPPAKCRRVPYRGRPPALSISKGTLDTHTHTHIYIYIYIYISPLPLNFSLRLSAPRGIGHRRGERGVLLPAELLPGGGIPSRREEVIASAAKTKPALLALAAAGALPTPLRQKLRRGSCPYCFRGPARKTPRDRPGDQPGQRRMPAARR